MVQVKAFSWRITLRHNGLKVVVQRIGVIRHRHVVIDGTPGWKAFVFHQPNPKDSDNSHDNEQSDDDTGNGTFAQRFACKRNSFQEWLLMPIAEVFKRSQRAPDECCGTLQETPWATSYIVSLYYVTAETGHMEYGPPLVKDQSFWVN